MCAVNDRVASLTGIDRTSRQVWAIGSVRHKRVLLPLGVVRCRKVTPLMNSAAFPSFLGRSDNGSGNIDKRAQLIKGEQFMVIHLAVMSEPNLSVARPQIGHTPGCFSQSGFISYQSNLLSHRGDQFAPNRDNGIL